MTRSTSLLVLASLALGGILASALHLRAAAARERAEPARALVLEHDRAPDPPPNEPAPDALPERPSLEPRLSLREPVPSMDERIARLLAEVDAMLALASEDGPDSAAAKRALAAIRAKLEERELEQRRAAQEAQRASWLAARASSELAQGWIDAAKQLDDAELRAQAIREIGAALASGDPEQELAALRALRSLGDVEFDKAAFRRPILDVLERAQGQTLVAGLYALGVTDRRPEDIALALRAIDDPEAYTSALHLAFVFSEGDLTGEVGAAVLPLLDASRGAEVRRYLNGLWGARVSPEIEARLLEMASSGDRDSRREAIYFGLSTLKDKSPAVVARLIDELGSGDWESGGRALWGLGHGVPEASWPTVAEAMRSLFEARSDGGTRDSALRLIGRYGGPGDVPWLEGLAANPNASQELRERAEWALRAIAER